MKAFYCQRYYQDTKLQSIISVFLDNNFEELSLEQIHFALRTLDDYIYILTGQPTIKIHFIENSKKTHKGHYSHNYDGETLENETMEIILKNKRYNGVEFLIIYLHEKYHQFQFHSVIEKNKDVEQKQLDIWTWCAEYLDSQTLRSYYEDYLANPIEKDTYLYQYDQILALQSLFLDKKKQKKAKRYLREEKIGTWVTNDINYENAGLTYIIIENAKRSFSPEDIFYRKKRV